jgi:hypothetical protein
MSIIRNPDPASLSWTYNPAKIVSPTPSPQPGGCHRGRPLEPNLGLDRRLCAFRASTIFLRQYSAGMSTSRSPPRYPALQERFRRGYHIYTSDGCIRKEGRRHITKQSVLWGWVAGFSVMVVLVGCAGTERMPAGKSRYHRLGRNSSISSVVDPPVVNVAAIPDQWMVRDIRYPETQGLLR